MTTRTVIATVQDRAAMLHAPSPTRCVSVPLELLPAYLKLHEIKVVRYMGWGAEGKAECKRELNEKGGKE